MKVQRVESTLNNGSQPRVCIRITWETFAEYTGHLVIRPPRKVI